MSSFDESYGNLAWKVLLKSHQHLLFFTRIRRKYRVWSGAHEWKSCMSQAMPQKQYLVAKIGFDTTESEPSTSENKWRPRSRLWSASRRRVFAISAKEAKSNRHQNWTCENGSRAIKKAAPKFAYQILLVIKEQIRKSAMLCRLKPREGSAKPALQPSDFMCSIRETRLSQWKKNAVQWGNPYLP